MTEISIHATQDSSRHAPAGQSRYGWLADEVRQKVVTGQWLPGSAIPAEAELAKEQNVALGTMRQALALLVAEGFLDRKHGRGTFVTSGVSSATMMRFFRFRQNANGGDIQTPTSIVVSKLRERANASHRALFGECCDRVLALTRVRSVDGAPCLFERIWLPVERFEALAVLEKRRWDDLFYPMYQRKCGVTVHHAEDEINFCAADSDVTTALLLPESAPCVRVSRLAFDLSGRCVEIRHSYGDASHFHYVAQVR
jgi:GntR family transcriptional regulator